MRSRFKRRMTEGLSKCRLRREKGAASIEYAILGSLIAAVIVFVVMNLGTQVRTLFETVKNAW
jgi:Flp pilus assembly pilin Flp